MATHLFKKVQVFYGTHGSLLCSQSISLNPGLTDHIQHEQGTMKFKVSMNSVLNLKEISK